MQFNAFGNICLSSCCSYVFRSYFCAKLIKWCLRMVDKKKYKVDKKKLVCNRKNLRGA